MVGKMLLQTSECGRIWSNRLEEQAGKAEGAKGVVVGRSHAAEGREGGGGGGCGVLAVSQWWPAEGDWSMAAVVERHSRGVQCSAVQCSSHERRRAATARRRLRPSDRSQAGRGVGRGGACVVRACRARAAAAQRAGGRGAAAGQRSSSKLAATQSTARTHAGSGQSGSLVEYRLHPFTRSRSRLVGVWQCNFSPAGRLAVSSAAPVDSRRIPVVLVLAAAALPKKPPD